MSDGERGDGISGRPDPDADDGAAADRPSSRVSRSAAARSEAATSATARSGKETNRLPLRAGAMLLLAIAVVCIGLGWRSAVAKDDKPDTSPPPVAQSQDTPPPATTVTGPSSAANVDKPKVCVYNGGTQRGLAQTVASDLKGKGWNISDSDVGNYASPSVTENTVFYGSGQKDDADKLATDVPNGASADRRPSAFTRCSGGLAVIVLN